VNDPPEITYFFPQSDSLIYTVIDEKGQILAIVRVEDIDSDSITYKWHDQTPDTLISSGINKLENSFSSDTLTYSFFGGEHMVYLTVTDNGEVNNDVIPPLSDLTNLSDSTSTIFKIGQPSISTVSNQVFIVNDVERFFSPYNYFERANR